MELYGISAVTVFIVCWFDTWREEPSPVTLSHTHTHTHTYTPNPHPPTLCPRHTLAPLVHEQWWRFSVCWFDPWREEPSFVCLVPEVLVQVGICDLLQGLHIVHRDKVTGGRGKGERGEEEKEEGGREGGREEGREGGGREGGGREREREGERT